MVRISFLTCVFLVGLRLVIGWHFFFEGVNKYESTLNEGAETYKPFSSAGYFAEAEGPLGPLMRDFIGDADKETLAKLKLAEANGDKPSAKMPAPLGAEWDTYAKQFSDFYKLNEEDRKLVVEKLSQSKADYVLWLTDKGAKDPKKEEEKEKVDDPRKNWIKGSIVGQPGLVYRPEADVQQRILAYQMFIEKLREDYEKVLRTMGKDVELTRLRGLKTAVGDIRKNLLKDIDEHTTRMKESLAKTVGTRLDGVDFSAKDSPKNNARVLEMVTPAGQGKEPTIDRMPKALADQWDTYVAFLKTTASEKNLNSPARVDEILRDAKLRYVRFLLDREPYTGVEIKAAEGNHVGEFEAALTEYLELAKKGNQPLTDKEKADVRAALDSAIAGVTEKSQGKPNAPFNEQDYQWALAKLSAAAKRHADPAGTKAAESKLIEQGQYEKALSLLRPADTASRIALLQLTLNRLNDAEKAHTAAPTNANKAAVEAAGKLVAVPRNDFMDDIRLHTDILRYNLGRFPGDTVKGVIEPEPPTVKLFGISFPASRLAWLNTVTRWTLLIAGGCLLLGLFTRLACFTCIVFLVNELLSNPALPWLPTSPKMEGNYTFVNKNAIELFALFVLLTLPTGRWLGLDAWLSCLWPFRRRSKV